VPDADDVEYREADGIAYLTLNRPQARNAVNSAYAHIANVICRYQPVQLRTSY
jgi:1,4-dihydroxy-2-naphthoyl-CoA synthase